MLGNFTKKARALMETGKEALSELPDAGDLHGAARNIATKGRALKERAELGIEDAAERAEGALQSGREAFSEHKEKLEDAMGAVDGDRALAKGKKLIGDGQEALESAISRFKK